MNSFKSKKQVSFTGFQGVSADAQGISRRGHETSMDFQGMSDSPMKASEEAWRAFERSGEVFDYMKYCNLREGDKLSFK